MVRLHLLVVFASWAKAAVASSSTVISAPQSTACGAIINDPDDNYVFSASLAYECLTSVPFNAAVATRFVQYYNDTLSFQSTLAYLKNPPPGYQQPSTDLMAGLHEIQHLIDNDSFANQYEFEAALQLLLHSSHDGHMSLQAGILAAFSFAGPFDIVSLSVDGAQLPKVYRQSDVIDSDSFKTFQPSPIMAINGQDVTIYLDSFAANNSIGTLEPHADWNQLMWSPVQDILGYFNAYRGLTTFYPGDTTTFEHENGTSYTDENLAVYWSQGPTGPLATGGDFYNFFVLGFYPASYDDESDTDSTNSPDSSSPSPTTVAEPSASPTAPVSWNSTAYPIPDVAQPDLGENGGGYISGYFYPAESLAVLSIPSFDEYGDALNSWGSTIDDFISKSRTSGLERVVIDLQQNSGGQILLALDTFGRFFPNVAPFSGSRLRAQHAADVMGRTLTGYFEELSPANEYYNVIAANEWVATSRINAETQRNFTSWAEFFGPHTYNDDNFTTTQQYNLSSQAFIQAVLNGDLNTNGGEIAPEHDTSFTPPYAAGSIILLTDGACGSACAVFLELMHYYTGVRVVTVGGRPRTGPMQGASGSRGARLYDTTVLDNNIDVVQQLLAQNQTDLADLHFLPNRTEALDVYVVEATVNLRDQVRPGGNVPLQFVYDAADCRIFFTPDTVTNLSALWNYAAEAAWSNASLCVADSTGYAVTAESSASGNEAIISAPENPIPAFDLSAYLASAGGVSDAPPDSPVVDGSLDDLKPRNAQYTKCIVGKDLCKKNMHCVTINGCSQSASDGFCVHEKWDASSALSDDEQLIRLFSSYIQIPFSQRYVYKQRGMDLGLNRSRDLPQADQDLLSRLRTPEERQIVDMIWVRTCYDPGTDSAFEAFMRAIPCETELCVFQDPTRYNYGGGDGWRRIFSLLPQILEPYNRSPDDYEARKHKALEECIEAERLDTQENEDQGGDPEEDGTYWPELYSAYHDRAKVGMVLVADEETLRAAAEDPRQAAVLAVWFDEMGRVVRQTRMTAQETWNVEGLEMTMGGALQEHGEWTRADIGQDYDWDGPLGPPFDTE